jgi:hypothetical protein
MVFVGRVTVATETGVTNATDAERVDTREETVPNGQDLFLQEILEEVVLVVEEDDLPTDVLEEDQTPIAETSTEGKHR